MGFEILVKTRGKDPALRVLRGDHYFEDDSWFPHTTMELIKVSDIIINFSSTVTKECIVSKKPLINFHIKPFAKRPMNFLYNYDFCKELANVDELAESINYLTGADLEMEYNKAIKKHLFPPDASKRIVDFVCTI